MYSKTRLPQPLLRVLRESSRPFPFSLRFHCLLPLPPPLLSSQWLNVFPISFSLRWRGLSALVTISLTVKSKPCHDWAWQAGLSEETWLTDCLTITLGNSDCRPHKLKHTRHQMVKETFVSNDCVLICIRIMFPAWLLCCMLWLPAVLPRQQACAADRKQLTKDVDLIMRTGCHHFVLFERIGYARDFLTSLCPDSIWFLYPAKQDCG